MAETAPAEFPFPNLGIFPANLRSHPKEKEVQLWKGSVVRSQMPINERVYDWFIPLTESDDGIGIRERWLSIDDPSSTGGWGGVKTVRILQDGLLRAMSNSLKLAYAIEEAREDAASVAVTTNTPRVDLEKYTLNCSLLVPENFSAYNDASTSHQTLRDGTMSEATNAEEFPFPRITLFPAILSSVDDAEIQVKYEDTLSARSDNTNCPVQCVTLSSMTLKTVHIPDENNISSTWTDKEDWDNLVKDSASGQISFPSRRTFQLWRGSRVQCSALNAEERHDCFIPLAEDGQGIRREWLLSEDPTERPGLCGARTCQIGATGLLSGMADTLSFVYELEEAREAEGSFVIARHARHLHLDKYTLNCSLLVPENFSAYSNTRAPVIILNKDFNLSAQNPVESYRGPVHWQTPITKGLPAKSSRQTFFLRLSSRVRLGVEPPTVI
uniref:Uncharacterized protein n=1 Tax=Kwoniella bestiolae CBS 10118 TaxID=1296100 RepID=A0A1B9FYV5_9TREE|nr:hypothetical protein I302_06935 [Kwoniella bestiolae CBS 10118]OCF23949.1 hypothetical protein I302_06935 [Kwoniella bestiolae CBS 10118]